MICKPTTDPPYAFVFAADLCIKKKLIYVNHIYL